MAFCTPCISTPTPPSSGINCEGLLQIPSLYVKCTDSVVPGASGQVDMAAAVTADGNTDVCNGSLSWEIVRSDAFFSAATINASSGLIDFTIDAGETALNRGEIFGKATCTDADGIVLSQFFTVTICAAEA